MCQYYYLPQTRSHQVDVHSNPGEDTFHVVCMDCNVVICWEEDSDTAYYAAYEHTAFFDELRSMDAFSKFMPRCECYGSYMATLNDAQIDAEVERAIALENYVEEAAFEAEPEEFIEVLKMEERALLNPVPLLGARLLIYKLRKAFR